MDRHISKSLVSWLYQLLCHELSLDIDMSAKGRDYCGSFPDIALVKILQYIARVETYICFSM